MSSLRRGTPNPDFELDAEGSRFTTRPAFAVQVKREWIDRSEKETGVASSALLAEFGNGWANDDPDMGKVSVLDGVQGRGAASWIPIVEWLGDKTAGGVVGFVVGRAAMAGIERIRAKIEDAKSKERRVMVSRGLAARIAADHVFRTTHEPGALQVEFAEEPSSLAGRSVTETSYTGLEPWIVSLVNGARTTRFILAVDPSGEIQGCLAAPMSEFEGMFSPVPPVE